MLAKCVAGRERDWDFAREMLRARLVIGKELLGRVDQLPVDQTARSQVRSLLTRAIRVTTTLS